ncbi:MAG: hypothetical protein JW760_04360 [Spirochaetales bacterium]|nr:hypothetical protein [Spirochaetales bacterium]
MLVFEDNSTWRGRGVLSERFDDYNSLSEMFSNLIKETKEVGQVFKRLVSTDRALIGQERYDLAEELEDLLGGYFFLYRKVLGGERDFCSRFCEGDCTFSVQFDGCSWSAEGILRREPVSGSFTDWFNSTLLKETSTLIRKFGTSLSDGLLDETEREAICRELNEAVELVLRADKGLKKGDLS